MSKNAFKVNQSLLLKPNTVAPTLPQDGELYYNSTVGKFQFRQNGEWAELGTGGAGGISSVDTMSVDTADNAVIGDYTQTGLEIVSNPVIHGTKTFRLIHQAASTYSFKKVQAVDSKFRSKNITFTLDVVSTATSSNLTILFRDETNSINIGTSQQITTGSQAVTATVTNASNQLTGLTTSDFNKLQTGAIITGTGIPTGTVITALSTATLTATLSNNATSTSTSSKSVSALTTKRIFTFLMPAGCTSFSWTISALAESGLPETYIDDISIQLTQYAQQSAAITVPKNNNFKDRTYSPVVTNNTNISGTLYYSRNENMMTIRGNLTWTGAGTTGYLNFPIPEGLTTPVNHGTLFGRVAITDTGIQNYTGVVRWNSISNAIAIHQENVSGTNILPFGSFSFTPNAGDFVEVFAEIPISTWGVAETETKTIPLTSSVIQTQTDTNLRLNTTVGYGSTGTRVLRFSNIEQSIGDGVQYISDSVNGDRFIIGKEGLWNLSFAFSATTAADFGITRNQSSLSTQINALPTTEVLVMSTTDTSAGFEATAATEAYLYVGDIIRASADGGTVSGTRISKFSMAHKGSTKIINPSLDQKVDIPTHELRFEGASARGSVATAIVKFDTLAKIKGDGFEVINTAADGTVVTIKKAGRLSVSASISILSSSSFWISKNQLGLSTTSPVISEVMAFSGSSAATNRLSASATFDVVIGDKIRISSDATPSSYAGNTLTLSLQETSVAVALQNVAPRWDDSDSAIRLSGGNGYGSSNTNVRRFTSVIDSLGSAITYSDSATLGASFTINESGVYFMSFSESTPSAASNLAITKNATTVLNDSSVLAKGYTSAPNTPQDSISASAFLVKGDIIRACGNGGNGTDGLVSFSISKVGKTQGTVDVTPFVNIPTQITQSSYLDQSVSFANAPITGNLTSNTNTGIYSYNSSTGVYTALRSATFSVSASFTAAGAASCEPYISKNGFILAIDSSPTTTNTRTSVSATFEMKAGETFTINNNSTNTTNRQWINVFAVAQSDSIVTTTQQVSSDTIPFVFKATAITDNDPVGTFNTYLYTANTNTAVIQSTAPTQTVADMNLNGIRTYARPFNSAGTVGLPARVDIKIGKGLKNFKLLGYANTGKTGDFSFDRVIISSTDERGLSYSYSEATGILSLNAGSCYMSSTTTRYIDAFAGLTNGYFAFNASKTPSLVSIPNLQQRVAYLSDVKPSGTAGGANVVGAYATRTLNTIVDNTGIVNSLASNQFTLPAGSYQIKAKAPAYTVGVHRTRIRNITDGSTALLGQSGYTNAGADNAQVFSEIEGEIVITATKTFELQHYSSNLVSNGFGRFVNSGENEVYSIVTITKIK
jgi:hypothetical protein